MDWSHCPDVERRPDRVSGAWVVKGTRVPADAIVENAKAGFSPEEIAGQIFDGLPIEAARRVIAYSRSRVARSA